MCGMRVARSGFGWGGSCAAPQSACAWAGGRGGPGFGLLEARVCIPPVKSLVSPLALLKVFQFCTTHPLRRSSFVTRPPCPRRLQAFNVATQAPRARLIVSFGQPSTPVLAQ